MRTFWNLNREFETQIDLVANKWFANFDSKAKGKCVPCGPWIIFELNTKCASFWTLKTEIDLVATKWFANFEPKAKAKWVPCGSWISFQLSPKMERKSDRAVTWIANFWLNLFVLRACRIIFVIWHKVQYEVFSLWNSHNYRLQNFTLLCANWLAKFFRAFCIVSSSDKVALEFRLYLKVELVAAETAKLNILNRM